MDVQRVYSCQYCPNTYARACHLRRHEKNHIADPAFRCTFCQAIFTRSDAARRHSKTCIHRLGRPIPQARRGRYSHACNSCFLFKTGCDGVSPCSSCTVVGRPCVYNRTLLSRSQSNGSMYALGVLQLHSCRNPSLVGTEASHLDVAKTESSALLLIFLARFTDPQNKSMEDYFGPSKRTPSVSGNSKVISENGDHSPLAYFLMAQDSWFWDSSEVPMTDYMLSTECSSSTMKYICNQAESHQTLSSDDRIAGSLKEIRSGILTESSSGSSFTAYSMTADSAELLFSPDNASSLIESFFNNWHTHCPILHRASFDMERVSPTLLAAMILMGAIYSPPNFAMAARRCLDAAEEYIFSHVDYKLLSDPNSRGKAALVDLSPLHAAYTTAVLQQWDTHDESRSRIRLHRFPSIVRTARNLGLPGLRYSHSKVGKTDCGHQDWDAIVRVEEAIRLMNWIFLVDTSHAIFHRTLPQIKLDEMTGSLPISEDSLTTLSAKPQTWGRRIGSSCRIPSVTDGITLLMSDAWAERVPYNFGRLEHLDLFILVSALHEIIFRAYRNGTLDQYKTVLRRALGRWKSLWDMNIPSSSSAERGFQGFYTQADEWWYLANLFLMDGCPVLKQAPQDSAGQDGMDGVYNLINQFSNLKVAG